MGLKFVHLINPVNFPVDSHHYFAQKVTFASIINAAQTLDKGFQVEFISSQFIEDRGVIPERFLPTPDLTRSILDIGTFSHPRKLPLISDLMERVYTHSNAEYVIYTNIDIAIQPHFYQTLDLLIDSEHSSATITRRTISADYQHLLELPRMYAEVGQPHRGWDTFIFPRAWIPQMKLGTVCLGATLVGLAVIANLVCLSSSFSEYRDLHLTFHLGNDRSWSSPTGSEYNLHNRRQVENILQNLENVYGRFPANSPPGRYLRLHRNSLIGRIFDMFTSRFHLPPNLTRRLR